MRVFLPFVLVHRALVIGQSIATSAISHDTGTGIFSFTMVGHEVAVGDSLRMQFTGGSANSAGLYTCTGVAGNVLTFQGTAGGTAITAVTSAYVLKAGSTLPGKIAVAAGSKLQITWSNPDGYDLGSGIIGLSGSLTSTGTSAADWNVSTTAGKRQRLLMVRAI